MDKYVLIIQVVALVINLGCLIFIMISYQDAKKTHDKLKKDEADWQKYSIEFERNKIK